MATRHMYYSDPAHINLKALQDSAWKAADKGEHVIIHYHKAGEICASNGGYKHEEFLPEGDN